MASLSEILDNAHDGEALEAIGGQFGLTAAQTEAAVNALLPAISMGLKRSTATVDGLGDLLGVMGQQQDLHEMYDDAETAFGSEGVAAGNEALSVIFGSPDVSRAVADHAQQVSGVSSDILKQLLPVLAGTVLSGLMRAGSTGKATAPQQPSPSGGSLGDILGQVFGREMPGSPGMPANRGQQFPPPGRRPSPPATEDSGDETEPGGDLLGTILRQLQKGMQEGRINPQGGSVQMPLPGGQRRSSDPESPQMPGGDIFGQILRDVFGGAGGGPSGMPQGGQRQSPQMKDLSDLTRQLGVRGGAGAAVFGDHFEVGRDVEKSHLESIQTVLDQFHAGRSR
jgi:hypothetical protein